MTGTSVFGMAFIVAGSLVALSILAEVYLRVLRRRLLRRRRAAAWREIHGRVRDGLGPGEETPWN